MHMNLPAHYGPLGQYGLFVRGESDFPGRVRKLYRSDRRGVRLNRLMAGVYSESLFPRIQMTQLSFLLLFVSFFFIFDAFSFAFMDDNLNMWKLYFQDPASPLMYGIIELHDFIMFLEIIILYVVMVIFYTT